MIRFYELPIDEKYLLAHAYETGNRATEHLTYKSPFILDPDKVIQAAIVIRKFIENKLNEKLKLTAQLQ